MTQNPVSSGYMNDDTCRGRQKSNRGAPKLKKLFVLGQIMGNALFHFLVENLPKIAPYLTDLLADPEIKILVNDPCEVRCKFMVAFHRR